MEAVHHSRGAGRRAGPLRLVERDQGLGLALVYSRLRYAFACPLSSVLPILVST